MKLTRVFVFTFYADVAELVDASDLDSDVHKACRFDSCHRYL